MGKKDTLKKKIENTKMAVQMLVDFLLDAKPLSFEMTLSLCKAVIENELFRLMVRTKLEATMKETGKKVVIVDPASDMRFFYDALYDEKTRKGFVELDKFLSNV